MNYVARPSTEFIAVHCSDTPPSMFVDEDTIRGWHLARNWTDIGYNMVILRDGTLQVGRPLDYQGAHVAGFNSKSLGICLIGGRAEEGGPEDNFTPDQDTTLLITLRFAKRYAPKARILGHRDFPGVDKDCPCRDIRAWLWQAAPDLL